jgi:hypothetical protein
VCLAVCATQQAHGGALIGTATVAHRQHNGECDVLEVHAHQDAWAAYSSYAAGGGGADAGAAAGEPVYSAELGLAIEAPRDGITLQQLWSIL